MTDKLPEKVEGFVEVESKGIFGAGMDAIAGKPWFIRFYREESTRFWEAWGVGSNQMMVRYGVTGHEGVTSEMPYKLLKSKVKDKRGKAYLLQEGVMRSVYLGMPEPMAPEVEPEPVVEVGPEVIEAPGELSGRARLKWLSEQRKKSSNW